jgi:hypothetical protein
VLLGAVASRLLCASCLIATLVCVQDNIVQPWEGEYLDWADFSIRVANEDMPQLADILQQVTPEEIQRLQEGMQRVWPRFLWHSALEVSGPLGVAQETGWGGRLPPSV